MTRRVIEDSGVATVCVEAKCPNLPECWSNKTATFMIMGDHCTRRCHYCAVSTAKPEPLEADEPTRLAEAVRELGLKHVVITAVARDDLADEGAAHYAECIRAVHREHPEATVEILPADMHARPELIRTLCEARPEIFNHNIETVERLTPVVRPQAKYHRSLDMLRIVREIAPHIITKSGVMVGLGESWGELIQTFRDLRAVDCDVLTIGQYLQPTADHAAIAKFYTPEEFDQLADEARALGFLAVYSGPFIRSSYNAGKLFEELQSRR